MPMDGLLPDGAFMISVPLVVYMLSLDFLRSVS
jgi:hypothetical protein